MFSVGNLVYTCKQPHSGTKAENCAQLITPKGLITSSSVLHYCKNLKAAEEI